MIPAFPEFKKIEFTDKEDVEFFTKKFPPYTNFNFTDMYIWDIEGKREISQYDGNLIVKFTDYLSGKPFLSFIGKNNLNETADKLIGFSKEKGYGEFLKSICHSLVEEFDINKFDIREDIADFDYILPVKKLVDLEGSDMAKKRNHIKNFVKNHISETHFLDFKNQESKEVAKKLFEEWMQQKGGVEFLNNEYAAFCRFLEVADKIDLISTIMTVDEKPVAFWICEKLYDNCVISHFEKAKSKDYNGIYPYLKHRTAQVLWERDISFINLEQDLGIQGLREAKKQFHPSSYLKKYIVELRK